MSASSAQLVARRPARALLFIVALFYAGVGYWLAVDQGFLMGDALSRIAAAQSVLFSRDPHAAAIGFVFTPLTALAELPLVALSPWWPELTGRALAAVAMSALFMAAAALQILRLCAERGLSRGATLAISALFAFNPLIVFYAANGMSEAPYLFFICWAVRRLVNWVYDDDVHDLVVAGVALGLGYLTRYDAVAPVAAASLTVAVITYRRARDGSRLQRAVLDGVLVASPGIAAFLVWAGTGWLLTGHAFAQLSLNYGNAAILAQSGGGATDKSVAAWFVAVSIALLAPTLPVLLVTAGWSAARRGEAAVVAVPVLVFGAVLAFQAVSYVTGSTFGFMRFYITAIPLAVFLAVLSLPARDRPVAKRVGRHARPAPDPPARGADRMSVLVSVLIAVGLPVTAWGMTQARYAPQEFALEAVLLPDPSDTTTRRAGQNAIIASFSTERQLAEYLDDQDLPRGSVLLDTVYGFAVLAATRNPDAFVIPSDYDFVEVLGDPAAAGVRYLLTVPNSGRGESDALNRQYPTVYDNGAGIATLDLEVPNDGADQPDWRVYRVLDQATP